MKVYIVNHIKLFYSITTCFYFPIYFISHLFQIAEEYDEEVEVRPQVIHVNLDSQLPLILREIHYLSQSPFDIPLPASAKEVLRNTDSFELRVTSTRLETIVSKYNTIMRTITEFEKPLFERKLVKIDSVSYFKMSILCKTPIFMMSTPFETQPCPCKLVKFI